MYNAKHVPEYFAIKLCVWVFFFLIKFILLQKRVSVIMPVTLSYIINIILKKLLKVYEKKCLSTKNIIVTNICTERQCRLRDH